jgi:cytidine deaminase
MDRTQLDAIIAACRDLITERFPGSDEEGGAAMLLADGRILVGTAPEVLNLAVESCHEVEPFAAAYRLDQSIVASVCLHRTAPDRFVVLSPCGVCRERLAVHGPEVLVAVADQNDPTGVVWKRLKAVLPDFWQIAFAEDSSNPWMSR